MSENINLNINKKKYSEFLFTNIIMPNIKENILTPQNITNFDKNKGNDIIYFSSNFCIKAAANLFVSLIFKNSNNPQDNINNVYMEYLNSLNKYHTLTYWKGNFLSDWKLYFKTSENMTGFIGTIITRIFIKLRNSILRREKLFISIKKSFLFVEIFINEFLYTNVVYRKFRQ